VRTLGRRKEMSFVVGVLTSCCLQYVSMYKVVDNWNKRLHKYAGTSNLLLQFIGCSGWECNDYTSTISSIIHGYLKESGIML